MAKKEFTLYGKTLEELKGMSVDDFAKIAPARARRSLRRGLTSAQQSLIEKIRKNKRNIETHCRNMIILPEMLGLTIKVHDGKSFIPLTIEPDMLGHALGEFAITRKKIAHSAPGVGATRSTSSMSVK